MEDKEKFREAYASRDGVAMAESLAGMFNRFGAPDMDNSGFTDEENTAVTICGYLTLFSLADWWKRTNCNGWDDRKKASAKFGYANLDILAEQFRKLTGLPAEPERIYDKDGNEIGADYALCQRMHAFKPSREMYDKAGYGWIPDFTLRMTTQHSTLQQSFIRWFVNKVLLPGYPEGTFAGNCDNGGISFPFI